MKVLFTIFLLASAVSAQKLVQCPKERHDICIAVYDPVCARVGDEFLTFSNGCVACRNKSVSEYSPGPCIQVSTSEESQEEQDNSSKCTDKERDLLCVPEGNGVCGYFDETINCLVAPCNAFFSNRCVACSNKKVAYVTEGKCPSSKPSIPTKPQLSGKPTFPSKPTKPVKFINKCQKGSPTICVVDRDVCGFFKKNIQCIKAPCAQTFNNECDACNNENIDYWVEGAC